ncbi:hypothetical protein [Subtercola lobariae]|uniref:Cupin n=1 Tax=Subtercola lobariae TaxID=1588641 RepID=A0A917EXM0_9MICO|nr:hypothetical protein [Subtercola lobariae]GGF31585.1 hypothetical protein GCM10011399_25960 [Subtercola lobariae]
MPAVRLDVASTVTTTASAHNAQVHADLKENPYDETCNTEGDGRHLVFGSLVTMPLRGEDTAGQLAVLEHNGERGYSAPMHRHTFDDETFVVLDTKYGIEIVGPPPTLDSLTTN